RRTSLMVLDTSAIVAVLLDEPERPAFTRWIEEDPRRLVSAASRVEATFVIESRKGEPGRERLERFFRLTGAEVVAVTPEQVEIACAAFRRYGKGRHPAGLNLGDVFAYALAKVTGEPLLFKGDDFAKTDIVSAA
ncbi:MAG: type II toxin-antitoxin system VapC family toxin, partial [Geminicoccales bacterium]